MRFQAPPECAYLPARPMLAKLSRIAADPRRYLTAARARALHQLKRWEHHLTPCFAPTAYFLQGQMDIHPTSRWYRPEFAQETGGFFLPGDPVERTITEFHTCDLVRRDMLILLLRTILERKIPGDLAEIGVYQGHTARLFHHYLPERPLHLFDTFSGFAEADMLSESKVTGLKVSAEFADTSVEMVLRRIAPRQPENIIVHAGFFPSTVPPGWEEKQFAFVHLDADLYEPILAGLHYFYPKLPVGGMIVVHDYNAWPGSRRAVTEFLVGKREMAIPLPDKSGSALIVKQ